MTVATDKAEDFTWMLSSPALTPEERARLERERDGWLRLDPLGIWDLIPNYKRPRTPADKMIAQWIEMMCQRGNDRTRSSHEPHAR